MSAEKLYILNIGEKVYYTRLMAVYAEGPYQACAIAMNKVKDDDDFLNEDCYSFQSDKFVMEAFVASPNKEEEERILADLETAVDHAQYLGITEIDVPGLHDEDSAEEFAG